jgi:hypothetical protein
LRTDRVPHELAAGIRQAHAGTPTLSQTPSHHLKDYRMSKRPKSKPAEKPKVPKVENAEKEQIRARRAAGHDDAPQLDIYGS